MMNNNNNYNNSYKWIPQKNPTQYPVYDKVNGNIPIGSIGVDIAFGQSSKTYEDKDGKTKNQNVYRWKGKIYNA